MKGTENKKFHTLENMRFSNYYAINRLVRTSRPRLAQLLRAIYAASYNETPVCRYKTSIINIKNIQSNKTQ